jgi:hypothetical protein
MKNAERRQAWHMATFHCKCTSRCISPQHFTVCTLCKACSCLVYNMNASQDSVCPCCRMNEYWDIIGLPCLACRCAAIVFRNPFQQRFHWHLTQWLTADDSDTSNDISLIRLARARNASLKNINTSLSNSTKMGSSSITLLDFDILQSTTQSIERRKLKIELLLQYKKFSLRIYPFYNIILQGMGLIMMWKKILKLILKLLLAKITAQA